MKKVKSTPKSLIGTLDKQSKHQSLASTKPEVIEYNDWRRFRTLQKLVVYLTLMLVLIDEIVSINDIVFNLEEDRVQFIAELLLLLILTIIVVMLLLKLRSNAYLFYREQLGTSYLRECNIMKRQCQNCLQEKVLRFVCPECRICQNCTENIKYHSKILKLCLQTQTITYINEIIIFIILRALICIGWKIYNLIVQAYDGNDAYIKLYFASTIVGIFINSLLLLFTFIFYYHFDKESKILVIKKQVKPPLPNLQLKQSPVIDPACSIDNMSPIRNQQQSIASKSPSPGKYRSGKILDFIDKKLASRAQSQQSMKNTVSQKRVFFQTEHQQSIQFDEDDFQCSVTERMRNVTTCKKKSPKLTIK